LPSGQVHVVGTVVGEFKRREKNKMSVVVTE